MVATPTFRLNYQNLKHPYIGVSTKRRQLYTGVYKIFGIKIYLNPDVYVDF